MDEALEFMRSLWRVNHALERVSKRMEDVLGVTAQQRMMIRCIGKIPNISAGQLAAQLHVDAGTVSATASRLEQRRILRRSRDGDDRRRVMLELTPKGRGLDRPTDGTVESAVVALLGATTARDVLVTRRVLAALTESLDLEALRPRARKKLRRRKS